MADGACCVVCLADVPKSTMRRRLNSASSKHVSHVLHDLGSRLAHEGASHSFLPDTDDTFLCRPCFRSAEKLLRMKKEVHELELELSELLKRSGEAKGLHVSTEPTLATARSPTARPTAVLPTTEGTAGSPASQSLRILPAGPIPPRLLSTRVTLPGHQHPSTRATPPRHQHLSTGAATPPRHQHPSTGATPPRHQHPSTGATPPRHQHLSTRATTPRHQHLSTGASPIGHCSRASLSPPPTKRQRLLATPIRRFLQQNQETASPDLAVSVDWM